MQKGRVNHNMLIITISDDPSHSGHLPLTEQKRYFVQLRDGSNRTYLGVDCQSEHPVFAFILIPTPAVHFDKMLCRILYHDRIFLGYFDIEKFPFWPFGDADIFLDLLPNEMSASPIVSRWELHFYIQESHLSVRVNGHCCKHGLDSTRVHPTIVTLECI